MQLFAGLKLKHEGETGLVLNPRIPIGNGSPLFDRCNAFQHEVHRWPKGQTSCSVTSVARAHPAQYSCGTRHLATRASECSPCEQYSLTEFAGSAT